MRKTVFLIGACLLISAGLVAAQTGAGNPGYYPIEDMGLFAGGDLEVDVDLSGPMLQVAAGAMQEDEDDDSNLAGLVSGLDRVRVQVGQPKGVEASTISSRFEKAVDALKSSGWDRILTVNDDDEHAHLFARNRDDRIVGLTLLVNDSNEELVLVNIVGDIDPVMLGKVLADVDNLPNLDALVKAGE